MDCRNALHKVEEFQLLEISKENYSCQTRLLGLEAKILMVMLNLPKTSPNFEKTDDLELKRACRPLF